MGYRSEVVIALNGIIEIPEEIKSVFDDYADFESKSDGGVVQITDDDPYGEEVNDEKIIVRYYTFNDIKWYEDYGEIQLVMDFLNGLDDKDFGFIRIGEDITDIETLGDYSEYDLWVSRSIEIG